MAGRKLLGRVRGVAAALLLPALAITAVANATVARAAAPSPFVTAHGTQLYLNGQPWYFTGYDHYQLASSQPGFQCGLPMSDAERFALMAQISHNSGSGAVRAWFFQSYQAGDPNNFSQFDAALRAAAAYNVKVIPTLVNQWGDCEPVGYRVADWYVNGYKTASEYPLSFRDFAARMAAHYRNDTRIAFWQLVNEAETMDSSSGPCDPNGAQILRSFGDDMANLMHATDPNHLVSLGTMGGGQCAAGGGQYQYLYSGSIDICEVHDYDGPYSEGDPWNGIAVRQQQCRALNKPLFTGEAGMQTTEFSSLQDRARAFAAKAAFAFNGGEVGFLIWSANLGPSQGYDVGPGDPTEAVMLAQQRRLDAIYGAAPVGHFVLNSSPPNITYSNSSGFTQRRAVTSPIAWGIDSDSIVGWHVYARDLADIQYGVSVTSWSQRPLR
jgi:hypothetical protein